MVITPGPLADHVPLERAAKGVIMTQFDKDAIERVGLVKIDLLGNRALATVDEACRLAGAAGSAGDSPSQNRPPPSLRVRVEITWSVRATACTQAVLPRNGAEHCLSTSGGTKIKIRVTNLFLRDS